MTLDQVPTGARIFVDSNILVYHFQPHPSFGPSCHRLLERIERQDTEGFTSTNLLGELAHRLMVIEAGTLPGWTGGKVLNRLKQQPGVVNSLPFSRRPSQPCSSPKSRSSRSLPSWSLPQPRSAGSMAS